MMRQRCLLPLLDMLNHRYAAPIIWQSGEGTVGFAAGVPIDVAALPATFLVYRTQPKETRDPLSVFLFPSFVLWKTGILVGAPFDLVEWLLWRSWQAPPPITPEQREAIERQWDAKEFSVYPVTPIYPR